MVLGSRLGRVVAGAAVASLAVGPAIAAPATAKVGGGSSACPAGTVGYKIDRAPVEGERIQRGALDVTIDDVRYKADDRTEAYGFDYTDNAGSLVTVIVKGGNVVSRFNKNLTTSVSTRLAPGGRHYEISYVKFCYRPGGGSES